MVSSEVGNIPSEVRSGRSVLPFFRLGFQHTDLRSEPILERLITTRSGAVAELFKLLQVRLGRSMVWMLLSLGLYLGRMLLILPNSMSLSTKCLCDLFLG
jgi:hypothetical protein